MNGFGLSYIYNIYISYIMFLARNCWWVGTLGGFEMEPERNVFSWRTRVHLEMHLRAGFRVGTIFNDY